MQNKRLTKVLNRLKKCSPVLGLFMLPITIVLINLYFFSPIILLICFLALLIVLGLFKDDRQMLVNFLKRYLKKVESLVIKSDKDKYYKIKKEENKDQ